MKTLGFSPKVLRPVLVGLVVAGVLLAVGEHERAVELLLAVAVLAGVGAHAPPGDVVDEGP